MPNLPELTTSGWLGAAAVAAGFAGVVFPKSKILPYIRRFLTPGPPVPAPDGSNAVVADPCAAAIAKASTDILHASSLFREAGCTDTCTAIDTDMAKVLQHVHRTKHGEHAA